MAVQGDDVASVMRALGLIAAESLSCELAAVYLAEGERIELADRGWALGAPAAQVGAALAGVLADGRFPYCVQDASIVPLPSPLDEEPGIRSYYLLELHGLARGVVLVAHTDAGPRGFTLLCRRLGLRLADVVSAQLGVALTREWARERPIGFTPSSGSSTPPDSDSFQFPSEMTSTVPSTTLIAVSSSIA